MSVEYKRTWGQPLTIPIPLGDLLTSFDAIPSQVSEVLVRIFPVNSRYTSPGWEFSLSENADNVLWDGVSSVARLVLTTEDFEDRSFNVRELYCKVAILLDGDENTTYEPNPDDDSYDIRLSFVKQGVSNAGGDVTNYSLQRTDYDDEFVPPVPPVEFNFPYYDVCYGLTNGANITAALQLALNNAHVHKKPIIIRAGEWVISSTVTTPFKSGLTLLGAGAGNDVGSPQSGSQFWGARTLLQYTGASGTAMLEVRGSDAIIGNFAIQGAGVGTTKGIVVTKPENGIGTGTILFKPLSITDMLTAVQCGTTLNMANCDNLRFEWLRVGDCTRGYHGINTMGMDIIFHQLNTGGNIGIEIDGGGDIWVQNSVVAGSCTLLQINDGDGVGKNNGRFRLSNTKVDAQAGNGFKLVKCSEPSPVAIFADGGMHSQPDVFAGTFAELTGANFLTLENWTSNFYHVTGTADVTYGRPAVLIRSCRHYGSTANIPYGALDWVLENGRNAPFNTAGAWINSSGASS